MSDERTLKQLLGRIDGRGYKAYKEIAGRYRFDDLELFIDHVQGDPFAAPSKVRVRVRQDVARIPVGLFDTTVRKVAAEDFIGRSVRHAIHRLVKGRRGTGKSGLVDIDAGGQEVLERTAVVLNERWVEARLHVGLPAAGRSVLGREAREILCNELPEVARAALRWSHIDQSRAKIFVDTIDNYDAIKRQLDERGLVAFVADGSILPRESGASDRPLSADVAVAFRSCPEYRVEMPVPHAPDGRAEPGRVAGMGIPKGVTLVVGGGYHGKSTLLRALERGVYPHVPGDGREYVVSNAATVKIRAEDGRRVENVDISAFISNLPFGRPTGRFSSDDASGSTSQAANILEAIEVGATALLLDEDTSATNFMVRDARMQALVHKEHEPITPFIDRVRELFDIQGVSTVLVMGGCGDYFDAADHVVMMRDYLPYDATEGAAAIAARHPTNRRAETPSPLSLPGGRIPDPASFDASRGKKSVKIDAPAVDEIRFGRHAIDLRAVEQLVDRSQTAAVGRAIHLAITRFMGGGATLSDVLDQLEAFIDREGLETLDPHHREGEHPGDFARPRRFEIAAAVNRLRTLRIARK
jgi:predicted ABC-class ATPase